MIKSVNKKILMSRNRVLDSISRFTMQYARGCQYLFDEGYLTSPTYFKENEFLDVFFSEFPNYRRFLLNRHTGNLTFNLHIIQYILKLNNDDEVACILSHVANILEAELALDDLKKLTLSVNGLPKKRDSFKVEPMVHITTDGLCNTRHNLNSTYVLDCISLDENSKLRVFNFSPILYKHILQDLRVFGDNTIEVTSENIKENNDIRQYSGFTDFKVSDGSSFSLDSPAFLLGDNFTVEDDLYFLDSLLSGDITTDTEFGKKLYNKIALFYTNSYCLFNKDNYGLRNHLEHCIAKYIPEFLQEAECVIKDLNLELVYINNYKIYYNGVVKDTMPAKDTIDLDFYIGSYLVDSISGNPYDLVSQLLGFSGEYITLEDVYNKGLEPKNINIINFKGLHYINGYYKIVEYQVCHVRDIKRLVPVVDIDSYPFKNKDKLLETLEVASIESLVAEVEPLVTSGTPTFRKLVGVLFQSAICTLCDYTLEGRTAPNHVVLDESFSEITKTEYLDACCEVQFLFDRLSLTFNL